MHKYLSYESGNNYGFVAGPYCTIYQDIHYRNEECDCKSVGLISCDNHGKLVFLPPKREYYTRLEEKWKLSSFSLSVRY